MTNYELIPCISSDQLQQRLDEMADQINRDYQGKSIIVVGVLKGAFMFLADLIRRLSIPVEVDFVRLASYGDSTETCGTVRISKDLELEIAGRDILIVEDIVDTGITLSWFLDRLRARNPQSIKVCTLIDKYERREVEVALDYVGLRLEKGFIVGYGLDFCERHRNLPDIHEVHFLQ